MYPVIDISIMFQCCSERASRLASSSCAQKAGDSCLPALCFGDPGMAMSALDTAETCLPLPNRFYSVTDLRFSPKGIVRDLLLRRPYSLKLWSTEKKRCCHRCFETIGKLG